MHRNRSGSGIYAPEERGDEVDTRGAKDHDTFARHALSLQSRRDCPRLDVEFEVGQLAVLFTVGSEAAVVECEFFWMQSRSVPRNIQQGLG